MAVPKKKTTPSKRGHRRSSKRANVLSSSHFIEKSTGMYGGKQIIVKKTKIKEEN